MRCFSLGLELLVVVLTYSLLVAPFFLFKKILFYSSFISMYVSACMYVYMYVHFYLWFSVCACVHVCISLYVYVHICVRVCLCLCVHLMQEVSLKTKKGSSGHRIGSYSKVKALERFWRDLQRLHCPLLASEEVTDFLWQSVSLPSGAAEVDQSLVAVFQGPQQADLGPVVEDPQKPIRLHPKEASDHRS